MNKLQIFNNTEFGELGIIQINDRPYFPAKKCAEILGYSNANDAIKTHCRPVVKHDLTDSLGRERQANFIPEGDLYRLIIRSKLSAASRFETWVFDEILPSIRKHGAYVTPDKMEEIMNDPDSWITLLTTLKNERKEKQRLQIEAAENKPKVIFADAVSVAKPSILIGELAKILKGNGIEIGQNRLFEKLRNEG
jgi:anti-repressor protein